MKLGFRLLGVIGAAGLFTMLVSAPAIAAQAPIHTANSAGYQGNSSAGITKFTGSVNVPTITCPTTGSPFMDATISLGGSSSGSLNFMWNASCTNGSLSLEGAAAIMCLGSAGGICEPEAQVNAAAGDSLTFSLRENTATSTTTITVINSTEQQTASASAHILLKESVVNAETDISGTKPGSVTPIPKFTPITFGNLKINGAILSSLHPIEFEMYDGTTLQVATSSISSTGTFTNTFKHV